MRDFICQTSGSHSLLLIEILKSEEYDMPSNFVSAYYTNLESLKTEAKHIAIKSYTVQEKTQFKFCKK